MSYIIHYNSKSVVLFPVLCDDAINPCDVVMAMMVMTVVAMLMIVITSGAGNGDGDVFGSGDCDS